MKIHTFVAILLFVTIFTAKSQVYSVPQYALDTIKPHTFKGDASLLFNASYEEMKDRINFTVNSVVGLQYISRKHDYKISTDWLYERGSSPNDSTHRAYFMVAASLFRYKTEGEHMKERRIFVAPLYLFQKNSDRGLERRHQIGLMVQPYSIRTKNFWINFLIGGVYSYASWDINKERSALSNGVSTYGVINQGSSKIISEFRPMFMVNATYKPVERFGLTFVGYMQIPTVVPHSKAPIEVYPKLGRLYPHIVGDLNAKFVIFKGLSLQAKIRSDYERTRPTIFKKGFEWSFTMGVNWQFAWHKGQ